MEPPLGSPLLIHNPRAGTGSTRQLDRLVAALRARDVQPDVVSVAGVGDGARIARDAAEAGRRLVVAVGGDGTLNDVLHGLVDVERGVAVSPDTALGVVGTGTGCDFARTFGLDRTPERLAEHLLTDAVLGVDVGRVRLIGPDGRPTVRLFLNVAEAGYGARVVQLANRLPRRLGRARYAAAIALSATRFRRAETSVAVDAGTTSAPLCNVVVANGQFFGGGLHVAPRALPTDGRLNVQAWGGTPLDVVRAQPQLRTGRHLARDDVREWQSARVTVESATPLPVELDGDVAGTTPATFEVLDQVLALKL